MESKPSRSLTFADKLHLSSEGSRFTEENVSGSPSLGGVDLFLASLLSDMSTKSRNSQQTLCPKAQTQSKVSWHVGSARHEEVGGALPRRGQGRAAQTKGTVCAKPQSFARGHCVQENGEISM